MNLGQLFESQLGLLAKELGVKFAVPTFGGFGVEDIVKLAQKAAWWYGILIIRNKRDIICQP